MAGPRRRVERMIEKVNGTPFQKKVWKATLAIPVGEVRSYTWIAKRIGHPKAVRAVGTALGKNPLAPIVPCHRVIRKTGEIGGYAGGPEKKRAILAREGVYL